MVKAKLLQVQAHQTTGYSFYHYVITKMVKKKIHS